MTAPMSAPEASPLSQKAIPPNLVRTRGGLTATELEMWRRLGGAVDSLAWVFPYGTPLQLDDDDCIQSAIGFPFQFYPDSYQNVWINSNGNLTFNGCTTEWWHPNIPDGAYAIAAPLYGDFDPEIAGGVYFTTVGIEPYRRFVVTWAEVPEYSEERDPSLPPSSFQAVLYEDSHQIQFGYNGLGTDGIQWSYVSPSNDSIMAVGISSGTGPFIDTATGPTILSLDQSNVCYVPDENGYLERREPCILFDPQCPDTVSYLRGPILESLRDLWNRSVPPNDTRERGGWIRPNGNLFKLTEWQSQDFDECHVQYDPKPADALAAVHTHPLTPGEYQGICGDALNVVRPIGNGPSDPDADLAELRSVPSDIIETNRWVHILPDRSFTWACGCINGSPPPTCPF